MNETGQKAVEGEARRRARGPRPDLCRRYARKEFAAGLPAILRCFVEKASEGSIEHAKALMMMSGVDKEGPVPALPAKKKRGRSLSEMLLLELQRRPAKPEGEQGEG